MNYQNNEPLYFSAFEPVPQKYKERFWEQGLPFYFKHNKENTTDTIIICLHGFTATPYEAAPIGRACFNLGMDAAGLLLKGHGFSNPIDQKKELIKMKKDNMLEAVRQEIKKARMRYKKVFIYGQSMGGAIAIGITGEGLVDACAVTAPALKLQRWAGTLSLLLHNFNIFIKRKPTEAEKHFFNLGYSFVNSKAGWEVQKLAYYGRKMLKNINCPVLEVHSHNDSSIDPIVASWVKNKVKGPVEIAWFDESDHTMPLDVKGKEVSETIAKFFNKVRQS